MKTKVKILLIFLALCSIALVSDAQLAMSLKMNRAHYLQYETVYAKVKILNNSGHAVIFGDDKRLQGKLLFKIIDRKNKTAKALLDSSYPMEGVIIEAGQSKEFVIPVSRFYDVKQCNRYRIYAFVEHNMFEEVYRSKDTSFEVSKGQVQWERTVGIPDFMRKKNSKVKQRTYKMVVLIEGSSKSNYLVIEDKRRIYTVLFLSSVLGEERITHEVDHLSRLHLLVPMSPKIFVYLVIDVNGKIDDELVYKRTSTVPSLVRAPDTGKVYVSGGTKAKKKADYN